MDATLALGATEVQGRAGVAVAAKSRDSGSVTVN
jgi:hypothetical protein